MPEHEQNKSFRVPPQNIDSERALLGSVMLKHDIIHDIADRVSQDAFYVEKHRLIFRTMLDLFSKNEPIDLLSVSSRLKDKKELQKIGGNSYLTELVNTVPAASNARYYAELVTRTHTLRNLIDAAEYIGELGYDESRELDEILDKAEKRVYEVTSSPSMHKFIALRGTLDEAWDRLDHLNKSKGELRGVRTGFPELDNMLAGFQRSDLIILASRPSMGKTSLALDIARRSAVQYQTPVGIFSLEMSAQQLVDRMLAGEARVDAWKLRTGKLSTDDEFDRIRDALEKLSSAPIYIDDQPANNILSMRSAARRLKREHGLELIVVDYLQMMVPSHGRVSDSLVQQVTEISRSLKTMARELDIPVLALSQLSRAVEQRRGRPRLSDLRDSGCLSGDTLITRADTGLRVPIKALVGRENIPVLSLDDNKKLRAHIIAKVFSSGVKQLFELKTRSGRSIKASGNHPFLTIEGWRRLDELKAHSHVALPRTLASTAPVERAMTDDELVLIAHLIGDGCVLPRQPIHYTSADMDNIIAVKEAAERLFHITPRLVSQKNWYHLYLPSPFRLTHGKHNPITAWYRSLGLSLVRSYEKRLPAALFTCANPHIRLFLHHLWATDGNISFKKLPRRKMSGSIYYATSSKQLARDVQHLLLRLGILSTLTERPHRRYRTMYHVSVQSAPMQIRFCELVGSYGIRGTIVPSLVKALGAISHNTNTDIIPQAIWQTAVTPAKDSQGMSWRKIAAEMEIAYNGSALTKTNVGRERLERLAEVLSDKSLKELARSDIYWDQIVSITPQGEEEVYDATVPGTHNFVADDFIVHNSIEQDADVVMFIHRDDKYNEHSDKPNIAEILIEKHRNGPIGKVELYFDERKTTFLSVEKSNFSALEEAGAETGEEF